ncbi:CBS domain-containing protein [Actinacidiphila glaucinigra]|uniref:CBS domain-containing protein n=1 Tax=Actinacidiphila glaucinigra TaxID=235986 RepID=UPI0037CC46D5
MRQRSVMKRKVVAVTLSTSFKEIVRTLKRWEVSALPVVADGTWVVGVVSEADLLRKEEPRGRRPTGRRRPGQGCRGHRRAVDDGPEAGYQRMSYRLTPLPERDPAAVGLTRRLIAAS